MKKLSQAQKSALIQSALKRQQPDAAQQSTVEPISSQVPPEFCRFDQHPGYLQMQMLQKSSRMFGVSSPFFRVHEGLAGATTCINNREMLNFASYNYLELSGHPTVNRAGIEALERYGSSVSASRIVSGERPVHQALEERIAELYDAEDAVVFVSGHATNVSTLGYLFGPKDLIVHDELIHNSSLVGAQLSGAKRLSFPHNDLDALELLLKTHRRQFQRVVIVVEGLYSMDGDIPDLPRLVTLKKAHQSFLMVDEAHSLGTLGKTGLGLREHFAVPSQDVDIWMGTLSKALAGCGGYIAGSKPLVELLRYMAPGFLYSVGIPAQVAAPSMAAIELLQAEPERVTGLQQISAYFLAQLHKHGFDTGHRCAGTAIVPVLTGSSLNAARLSEALLAKGINVQPIFYPAVPEKSARLRFFLSCGHSKAQIDTTITALQEAYGQL